MPILVSFAGLNIVAASECWLPTEDAFPERFCMAEIPTQNNNLKPINIHTMVGILFQLEGQNIWQTRVGFRHVRQKCAGENWNAVMYDGMRATNAAAALYFLFIVIIGNYVVLNLFLAILLEQFSSGDKDEAQTKVPEASSSVEGEDASIVGCESEFSGTLESKAADASSKKFRPLHEPIRMESGYGDDVSATSGWSRTVSRLFLQDEMDQNVVSNMLEGRSLFIFGARNPVRVFMARIVWHQKFEQLIITLIALSSMVLAIDAPSLDPNSNLKATLVRV